MTKVEYAPYRIVREISEVGRTRVKVACDCGGIDWAFVWSWAGHGKKRRSQCGRFWLWGAT